MKTYHNGSVIMGRGKAIFTSRFLTPLALDAFRKLSKAGMHKTVGYYVDIEYGRDWHRFIYSYFSGDTLIVRYE